MAFSVGTQQTEKLKTLPFPLRGQLREKAKKHLSPFSDLRKQGTGIGGAICSWYLTLSRDTAPQTHHPLPELFLTTLLLAQCWFRCKNLPQESNNRGFYSISHEQLPHTYQPNVISSLDHHWSLQSALTKLPEWSLKSDHMTPNVPISLALRVNVLPTACKLLCDEQGPSVSLTPSFLIPWRSRSSSYPWPLYFFSNRPVASLAPLPSLPHMCSPLSRTYFPLSQISAGLTPLPTWDFCSNITHSSGLLYLLYAK